MLLTQEEEKKIKNKIAATANVAASEIKCLTCEHWRDLSDFNQFPPGFRGRCKIKTVNKVTAWNGFCEKYLAGSVAAASSCD